MIADKEIIEMAQISGCTRCSTLNIITFARLIAKRQREQILDLIKAYGDARFHDWKGDPQHPDYRSTYMEGMCDASDDILSHVLKETSAAAILAQEDV